jgi:hypothetical protein
LGVFGDSDEIGGDEFGEVKEGATVTGSGRGGGTGITDFG